MSYSVLIKKNATGEIRKCNKNLEWNESSHFWWTDGNMGCDCNRYLEFQRANNEEENEADTACGYDKYTVLSATLEDGTVVVIDEPAKMCRG